MEPMRIEQVRALDGLGIYDQADWSGAEVEKGQCEMCGRIRKRYVIYNMHNGEPMAACEKCMVRHNIRAHG